MGNRRIEGYACLAAFAVCIPAANWMIGHVGTTCTPGGPCLIPVGPGGRSAPSGVLMVGLALVLRDLLQRRLGLGWTFVAIASGALLSATFATSGLVVASVAAFLFSEVADLAVFTPLQRRGLVIAVIASSFVGLMLDSMIFLYLAFGSLGFLEGQIIGKSIMVVLSLPLVAWFRRQENGPRGTVPVICPHSVAQVRR